MLYVVPSAWGSAVARDLLAAVVADVRAAGRPAARTRVVEAQARARRFYEREGWYRDPRMAPASNSLFRLIYYRCGVTH
jgi:GNAT superfamily N-acetyltransferase